jgi:hypothetical protein
MKLTKLRIDKFFGFKSHFKFSINLDEITTFRSTLINIGKHKLIIGLNEKLVENALQKKKFGERLKFVIREFGVHNISTIDKEIGNIKCF